MRAQMLRFNNKAEIDVVISAVTDFMQMTEDLRKEPSMKLGSLSGQAFEECLSEINSLNHMVHHSNQLIARVKRFSDRIDAEGVELLNDEDTNGVYINETEGEIIGRSLEMTIERSFEMEPFYRLLNKADNDAVFTHEQITKLKDEVESNVATLIAAKDVYSRLK